MSIRKLLFILVCACLSLFGCKEGDRFWDGRVRVFNAIPDVDFVTVSINGSEETRLFYGEFSNYLDFDSRQLTELRVFVPGGTVPVFQGSVSVAARADRTVAVVGPKELEEPQERYVVSLVTLTDIHVPQIDNSSAIRFVNLSPSAGPFDISVNSADAASGDVLPRYERLQFRDSTGYLQALERVQNTIVTLESTDSGQVLYSSPKLNLNSRQVVTYYILDRSERGLPVVVVTMVDSDF
jgi:hypothetical protein